MVQKSYITTTEAEKSAFQEALNREFGENRISHGAYVRFLAEKRLEELTDE